MTEQGGTHAPNQTPGSSAGNAGSPPIDNFGHTSGDTGGDKGRTWYEEFTVSGSELLEQVKSLIREGNVRRLFIKNGDGETVLEIPLTAGVAVTAITAIVAPVLVAVGAIAALLTKVTIGVERGEEGPATPSDEPTDAPPQPYGDIPPSN